MEDELVTSETLPEEGISSDGGEAEPEGLAQKLSQVLGKKFDSDDAALKAVKDTFSYVGKVGKYSPKLQALEQKLGGEGEVIKFMEQISNEGLPQVDTSKFVSRDEFEADQFFRSNPDYAEQRELISALQKGTGKPLSEVVQMDSFKSVFEAAKSYKEVESKKSVLQSNPKLGQVSDKMSKAQEIAQSNPQAAASLVTEAVLDAYDLK